MTTTSSVEETYAHHAQVSAGIIEAARRVARSHGLSQSALGPIEDALGTPAVPEGFEADDYTEKGLGKLIALANAEHAERLTTVRLAARQVASRYGDRGQRGLEAFLEAANLSPIVQVNDVTAPVTITWKQAEPVNDEQVLLMLRALVTEHLGPDAQVVPDGVIEIEQGWA